MAYTATVTKVSVSQISGVIFNCTIRIVINDGVDDVFDETASKQYNSNSTDMDAVKADLQQQLITKWDKYIAEKNVFDKPAFDTLVADIQAAANNYINP